MKANEACVTSQEVHSFEEYTIYSLEQSVPALLQMMEMGKRIASAWPDIMALAASAGLCKEVATLATFQNALSESLGEIEGSVGEDFYAARANLQAVMDLLGDGLNFHDPDIAQRLFGSQLPEALHEFALVIPRLKDYILSEYLPLEREAHLELVNDPT